MASSIREETFRPRFLEPSEDAKRKARDLAGSLGLHPVLAQVLINRSLLGAEEIKRFLNPRLLDLTPPDEMADFQKAVELLALALRQKKKIGIFGDYDVDGITSAAVLATFLKQIGSDPLVRIANRSRGYGLRPEDVEVMARSDVDLLVACDVGSSDLEAVALARKMGMEVMVLDHHHVPATPPPASVLVNPGREGCLFPDSGMASVGLVFYLVAGLRTHLVKIKDCPKPPDPRDLLDLVALGTVADVAPLTNTNRILVTWGIRLLRGLKRPGLRVLAEVSGMFERSGEVSIRDVAFRLAPRLNAAGRMGDATPAFELLMEDDKAKARHLANLLDEMNRERQSLQDQVFEAARQQVDWGEAGERILVVDGAGWHPGVVGIVASKLVETYKLPAVVIALEETGAGRGSARSISGLDLYECLTKASGVLESFGGHAAAAGLMVRQELIVKLRKLLNEAVGVAMKELPPPDLVPVDVSVALDQVNESLLRELEKVNPTGAGNPDPVLLTRKARVRSRKVVGNGHIKLMVTDDSAPVAREAIGFSMVHRMPEEGESIDMAYVPERNTYRGSTSIQLRLVDLRRHQQDVT